MSDNGIKQAVQQLAGTHLRDTVHVDVCEVGSVNIAARTCNCTTITGAGTDIINVQLMAEVEDGILMVPAIGSTVIVGYTSRNLPFIHMFSSLQSVLIVIGGQTLYVTSKGFMFNQPRTGAGNGGLMNIAPTLAAINSMQNDLNAIKQAFQSWVVVPNDGGAALKAVSASWAGSNIQVTQRGDIEDTNVLH